MTDLFLVNHPLVQVKLTQLRDQATPSAEFRRLLREMTLLLFATATDDLGVEEITVTTPLADCAGRRLHRPVVFAPILRAGLGMLEGIHDLLPEAVVAHIGIYREESTLQPHHYFTRVPANLTGCEVVVLDPMLATGQSAATAVRVLKEHAAEHLRLICVVSCPPGIEHFHEQHPDVPIYTASVDEGLDERGFIVPGLGDAGDRFFGTTG